MKAKNITGNRYGKLVAIKKNLRPDNPIDYWDFRCDCGNTKNIRKCSVTSGCVRSCGCVNGMRKHGMYKTRIYRIWVGIMCRCGDNCDRRVRKYYVDKGIGVQDSWRNFVEFYKDMGDSYEKHVEKHGEKDTQIDRVDNGRGYFKDNCRWVTVLEQANNTTKSGRTITAGGKTKTVSEWGKETGIAPSVIRARIKYGWDKERAVLTPNLLPR